MNVLQPATYYSTAGQVGVAMLGIFAFSKLGVDLLPNVALPHLMVQTTYKNATLKEITC